MADNNRRITLSFNMDKPTHKTAYEFLDRLGHKKSYIISELFTYLTHMYGTGWDRRNADRFLKTILDSSDGNAPVLGLSTPIPEIKSSNKAKPSKKEIIIYDNPPDLEDDIHVSAVTDAPACDPKIRAIDFAENYILSICPDNKKNSLKSYWTELRREGDYDTLYEEVILFYEGDYEGKGYLSFEEFINEQLYTGGNR